MRASKSNRRRVGLPGGKRKRLWAHMREAKSLGVRKVEVPPAEVGGETMRMVAVSAREERPPKTVEAKKKALHWLLPATECEIPATGRRRRLCAGTSSYQYRIECYFDAITASRDSCFKYKLLALEL